MPVVGPFAGGSVNLGEFIMIVDGLRFCQQYGLAWPVYSDSRVVIRWVSERCPQTAVERSGANAGLFRLFDDALAWLHGHAYTNPVLKWETACGGRIWRIRVEVTLSDYGRAMQIASAHRPNPENVDSRVDWFSERFAVIARQTIGTAELF